MENNISILEYYKERNKDKNYVEEYQSTSDKKSGKTFWHINVNFRSILTFVDVFPKFLKYDNKDRNTWDVYDNNEQKAKHWTVRMQESKLFKRKDGVYSLTAKGLAFKDFVEIVNDKKFYFAEEQKWVIVYYFILNSYFNYKPNYIIKRTNEVFEEFKKQSISIEFVKNSFVELLKKENSLKKEDLFQLDAFWILTFYKDKDFLSLYLNSSKSEKMELYDYVINMSKGSKEEVQRKNDLIGWKFVSGGQYNVPMFVDDVKTLYVTYFTFQRKSLDPITFLINICDVLGEAIEVDYRRIKDFIELHLDVFDVIFSECVLNKTIDDELNEALETENRNEDEIPNEEKEDDTTSKSDASIRRTSQILKRMAKDRSKFKCELESINSCKYFTSKENGKNYLEIHHLIPFEFNNDFEKTLEVLPNYVALCPHCHRLLHFGVDRERKGVLTYLYNQRKADLKKKGLDLDLETLFKYYGVDE